MASERQQWMAWTFQKSVDTNLSVKCGLSFTTAHDLSPMSEALSVSKHLITLAFVIHIIARQRTFHAYPVIVEPSPNGQGMNRPRYVNQAIKS